MKKTFTLLAAVLLAPCLVNAQFTEVIPNAYATTDVGTTTFTGPYATGGRSYQLLMDASLLTTLLNNDITGFTFRSASTTTSSWPAANTTYANYDVYLGPAVSIPMGTNVFATNEAGTQTLVRSGSMTVPASSFPAGGPSSWGHVTNFTIPYNYTGGNLALLIRHDGGAGSNRAINALGTSTTGYNTVYKACWQSGYTALGSMQGNFGIIQFTYSVPLPVNLVSFDAKAQHTNVLLQWATASEKNTAGFTIERSTDGSSYEGVYHLPSAGNSESLKEYEYRDVAAFSHGSALYYRLKMEDKDGSSRYSKVVKLNRERVLDGSLVMAPNVVSTVSTISFSVSEASVVSYHVFDMKGRLVRRETLAAAKGGNSVLLELGDLQAGNYILRLTCAEFEDEVKFVKQ